MRVALLPLLSLLSVLSACTYNLRLPYLYEGDPGVELQPGESATLRFFTSDSRADSGVAMLAGVDYDIGISLLSNWIDGSIDTNERGESLGVDGFADSLMPREFYGMLKRSRSHRWFELMVYQDNCPGESLKGFTELDYDAEQGTWLYRATCTGKASLHVNDAFGFYGNNAGYANITITRR
ncbi:MAG: hypothetical protein RLZZ385_569 [Pseudomonadota bacterium]|jgi:hypothetical protein